MTTSGDNHLVMWLTMPYLDYKTLARCLVIDKNAILQKPYYKKALKDAYFEHHLGFVYESLRNINKNTVYFSAIGYKTINDYTSLESRILKIEIFKTYLRIKQEEMRHEASLFTNTIMANLKETKNREIWILTIEALCEEIGLNSDWGPSSTLYANLLSNIVGEYSNMFPNIPLFPKNYHLIGLLNCSRLKEYAVKYEDSLLAHGNMIKALYKAVYGYLHFDDIVGKSYIIKYNGERRYM